MILYIVTVYMIISGTVMIHSSGTGAGDSDTAGDLGMHGTVQSGDGTTHTTGVTGDGVLAGTTTDTGTTTDL